MSIAFESIQSASVADNPLVIPKPTGLAVGDEMFAVIEFNDDNSGSGGINTPSGWNLLQTLNTGSPTHVVSALFNKTADSSDVAASNFTFTRSGGDSSYHMIGHLIRISGYGFVAGSTSNSNVSLGATTITATGFTPTRPNCLLLGFLLNSGTGGILNTSIALTTNNPTWTERAETQFADSSRTSTLSVYTATRSEETATGTITGTFASSVATDAHMVVFALAPRLDGQYSAGATKLNIYGLSPLPVTGRADAQTTTPDFDTYRSLTEWNNTQKPATTNWLNQDK